MAMLIGSWRNIYAQGVKLTFKNETYPGGKMSVVQKVQEKKKPTRFQKIQTCGRARCTL